MALIKFHSNGADYLVARTCARLVPSHPLAHGREDKGRNQSEDTFRPADGAGHHATLKTCQSEGMAALCDNIYTADSRTSSDRHKNNADGVVSRL